MVRCCWTTWRASSSRRSSAPVHQTVRSERTCERSSEDWDGDSNREVREEPSAFEAETGTLQLQHTTENAEKGRRAYFPDVMDGFPCHQDVQLTSGQVLLLQYVNKYGLARSEGVSLPRARDDPAACRRCFPPVAVRYRTRGPRRRRSRPRWRPT